MSRLDAPRDLPRRHIAGDRPLPDATAAGSVDSDLEPVESTDGDPGSLNADDLAEWPVEAADVAEPRIARVDQLGAERDGRRDGGLRVRPVKAPGRRANRLHLLYAAAAGLGVVGFVGRWWAVPIGVAAAVGVGRFLRGQEPAEIREARKRAVAELPLGADLLAAALRAGAPVDRAVSAVAEALGGPLGERLERVARSLRLGADPDEAWAHLSDVAGGARLISAAIRSSSSGGALAGAFTRLADDLRADRTVAVEAAARRAGVLIVLPLGLCFLPAFVLAGLVPVMVAVVGDVL
jgi:Flp pilus assembly protein TadB